MRDTKQCSSLSKKVVNFLFLCVLQSFLFGKCDKVKISSDLGSPGTTNLVDTTSINAVGSDSGVGDLDSIDGSIEKNEKVDDELGTSKKVLFNPEAYWNRLKRFSEKNKKKEVEALDLSEAQNCLLWAIKNTKIKLVKILLQYRTVKFEDLLKAIKQVVSLLSPDKVSEKVPEMFHCVFMKLLEQPDFSVDHLREQDEKKRTLLHYLAMLDGHIDAWEIILKNVADPHQGFSKFLYIKDKSGMTPLHHLVMSGAGGNIWQIILEKLPESSLCLQDGSNMTPLHYLAMSSCDSDIWKIILENISSDSLCKEDDDEMTVLHYLVDYCKEENKIKPFELVFKQIVDKLGADCVIKELFKKAIDAYSVIERSYLPQESNFAILPKWPNNPISWISSWRSKIELESKNKGSKVFSSILALLPRRLENTELGIIAREIEDKVEDKSISQEYANKLCAIIDKYIDKNYGNKAKEVRGYVLYARYCKNELPVAQQPRSPDKEPHFDQESLSAYSVKSYPCYIQEY